MWTENLKATIYFEDLKFKVRYNFYPGYPQTRWEPAEPADVERTGIFLEGEKLSDKQEASVVKAYGENELEDVLHEDAAEQFRSYEDERADFLYDELKERRKGAA